MTDTPTSGRTIIEQTLVELLDHLDDNNGRLAGTLSTERVDDTTCALLVRRLPLPGGDLLYREPLRLAAIYACDPDEAGASLRDQFAATDTGSPVGWYAGLDYREQGGSVRLMLAVGDAGRSTIVTQIVPTGQLIVDTVPDSVAASLHPALHQTLTALRQPDPATRPGSRRDYQRLRGADERMCRCWHPQLLHDLPTAPAPCIVPECPCRGLIIRDDPNTEGRWLPCLPGTLALYGSAGVCATALHQPATGIEGLAEWHYVSDYLTYIN